MAIFDGYVSLPEDVSPSCPPFLFGVFHEASSETVRCLGDRCFRSKNASPKRLGIGMVFASSKMFWRIHFYMNLEISNPSNDVVYWVVNHPNNQKPKVRWSFDIIPSSRGMSDNIIFVLGMVYALELEHYMEYRWNIAALFWGPATHISIRWIGLTGDIYRTLT